MIRRTLLTAVLFSALPLFASTYTVNDLGDAVDQTPNDNICATAGAVCTFRAAIRTANEHPGIDTIAFNTGGGVITIGVVVDGVIDPVIIDGTTEPTYAGTPVVRIEGSPTPWALDFLAGSSGSSVTGLQFTNFSTTGIQIGVDNVTLQRNYIGPVTAGSANAHGVLINGANSTLIGGANGAGNVISGNSANGIWILNGNNNTVSDNLIGVNAAGTATLPNGGIGVSIIGGSGNTIGNTSTSAWNVISGNAGGGVWVNSTTGTTVAGNFIGTDLAGTTALGNGLAEGVLVFNATNTNVGTSTARNVIGGHSSNAIRVTGTSTNNVIDNNYVGVDVTGTAAVPNNAGIFIEAPNVNIGTAAGPGNVISGNVGDGIHFNPGATNVVVRHNIIGLDATGANIIGNGSVGVNLCCTSANVIGGGFANEGNVISGNGSSGIFAGVGSQQTVIRGNIIGLRADGTDVRGNSNYGISLNDVTTFTVGGPAGQRNIISGNSIDGLLMTGNSTANTITGNYIGTDPTGTVDLGNLGNGIAINGVTGAFNTFSDNVVSGNDLSGISISMTTAIQSLPNNIIGRNATNTANLPNFQHGVSFIEGTANMVMVGNTIAGNGAAGVRADPTTTNNVFSNNDFFGNTGLGIELEPLGVNANDAGDGDSGPNTAQNYPTITYATSTATSTQIGGTINTTPNTIVTIFLYANTAADPSGFGEGETVLGNTGTTTDGSGNATFIFNVNTPTPLGRIITGTATVGGKGTSEFSAATVTVAAAPTVQFSSATYNVGESGGSATITVTRTGDTMSTVTVDYATSPGGTATAGADYTSVSNTLTFGPGVTSQTFNVPITSDTIDEPNETVNLTLSNPGAATLGLAAAVLTITDDDPTPAITIADPAPQAEGNSGSTNMTFTVTLSNPSSTTITVDFTTAPDTATAGSDYTTTSNTLTFNPGITSQQINVPILGDTTVEPDETFFVNLSNASPNAAIADNQAQGTIVNDDAAPAIAIPTLSEWMLLLLAAALAVAAATRIRM